MYKDRDSQAVVTIAPETLIGHPDLNAMLQAFYSRSHTSIVERLEDFSPDGLDADKIRESLSKFYIGYGHESIADCGNVTLFIEGVSFLTAKAIQDTPLYNGQESSSRYIDFSNQATPNFLSERSTHNYWMQQYCDALPKLDALIQSEFPNLSASGRKPKVFDIARGLLPMTALTQLSWHGSIRDIRRHVARLLAHPYDFVAKDAMTIYIKLVQRWPDLFDRLEPDNTYKWFVDPDQVHSQDINPMLLDIQSLDDPHMEFGGTTNFFGYLDYAGYRDAQRHRASYTKSSNPLLRIALHGRDLNGFYGSWLRNAGMDIDHYLNIDCDVMPLLTRVGVVSNASLPQWKYVIDMRTKPMVHTTVRKFYTDAARDIYDRYPNLEALELFNVNMEESDYERRAKQTITERTPT